MSILIAFLGGMLTLLSPCTLPVIPLLFASVRGRRGQLAIMLAGMALMFGAVSAGDGRQRLGGESDPRRPRSGAGVLRPGRAESAFTTRRATADLTLVALGNQLNDASSRQRGWIGSLLAGLAVGLLWAPCAGPVLGAILSLALCIRGRRLPAACCWPTAAAGR